MSGNQQENDYFSDLQKLFRATGFNIRSNKRTFHEKIRTYTCLLVIWMPVVQLFIEGCMSDSLVSSTESFVIGITVLNSANKFVAIYSHEELVVSAYSNLRVAIKEQLKTDWKKEILVQSRLSVEKIQKMFLINFTICVAAALINTGVTKILNPEGGLPLREWFPFSIRNTKGYIAGFVIESITTSINIITFSFGYMTFCGLIIHTSAQMKIWEKTVQQIFQDNKTIALEDEKKKIKTIVFHHRLIMSLVQTTNHIFGNVLFMEIILSSLQSCLVAFQCSKRPFTDPKQGFFIPFLLCTTIMPASICWCGELLKTRSQEMSQAIYESGWYLLSPPLRKDVLIMLRQSSKPLQLSAKDTFHINMETFLKTIQTAYSYLAMLRTVDN